MTEMSSANRQGEPVSQSPSKVKIIGVAAVTLAVLLTVGIVPRVTRSHEAKAASEASPVTHAAVSVIAPVAAPATTKLILPGNLEPLYTAALYARTDGYMERRTVDIGSPVRKGQLIAVISSPEVDQQLMQAQSIVAQMEAKQKQSDAMLVQAKANVELSRLTRDRDIPLGKEHALSQQAIDNAVQTYNARAADVNVAEANIVEANANVSAARANVRRLEELKGFESVRAPFDGVITERNVERGDLIALGPNAKPLFRIAQSQTMRTFIDVPQSDAIDIKDGDVVAVSFRERVGRIYKGTITRNTHALDAAAKTMRVEVDLDNRDGSLLPGMYADVQIAVAHHGPVYILQSSALVVDQRGARVAVVRNNRIHFVPVVLGRDLGEQTEVISGIQSDDRIVNSPSDLLSENQEVEIR